MHNCTNGRYATLTCTSGLESYQSPTPYTLQELNANPALKSKIYNALRESLGGLGMDEHNIAILLNKGLLSMDDDIITFSITDDSGIVIGYELLGRHFNTGRPFHQNPRAWDGSNLTDVVPPTVEYGVDIDKMYQNYFDSLEI